MKQHEFVRASTDEQATSIARVSRPGHRAVTAESASGSGASGGGATGQTGPGGQSQLLSAGTRIGQYEVIRELGRGGMGAVYLARDIRLGRRVALKLLQRIEPGMAERFLIEARATAQCSHENIVVIHDVGEVDGYPFMVLEYLDGAPLGAQLARGRSLPPARAVDIMVPVVRALACAHEQGIVHRDLKPDNIVVTAGGTIKVLDFGIAKLVHERGVRARTSEGDSDEAAELTRSGALIGTLPYMSPEQWGAGEVDHRTDLWAVGILLFRMITGQHPLAPRRGMELGITAVLDEPMPRVRDVRPDVPEALAAVIDHCLIKRKELRVQSARELLAMLEPLLPGQQRRQLDADQSPYAGLRAFQEADADRFHGRGREVAALATRLGERPLVAVVGPSGVGKSSFVRAGVIPALKSSGESWEAMIVRPGRQPMAALASMVAPIVGTRTGITAVHEELGEQQKLEQRLRAEPGHLGVILRHHARRRGGKLLVFIDQFEELYTLTADIDERLAYTACLAAIADDATAPLRVVVSIRSDFLDRVAEDRPFLSELSQGLFFLSPPGRDGLRDALVQPAEMAGYGFEDAAMVAHMLDALDGVPGALPLLQFAAAALWEARDVEQRLLTRQSYERMGGMAGALASHAAAVMDGLSPRARELVRPLMVRLVTPERTRAIASVDELCQLSVDRGEVAHLIDHLVQARLLVVHGDGADGSASVEIVHESLIHTWVQLRRWLDEGQEDAAFLEQLRTAARQWQARGRPVDLLWRGEAMNEARRWARRYRGELATHERAYLDAVLTLRARTARRRRLFMVAIMVFLSALVVAAGIGMVLVRDAEQAATEQARAARWAEKEARAAEAKVRDQLETVQAAVRAREEAEGRMEVAEGELERANRALEERNRELASRAGEIEAKNAALIEALDRAERDGRRARKAEQGAHEALGDAEAARRDLEAALAQVERLLTQERERVRRLENEIGALIEQLR